MQATRRRKTVLAAAIAVLTAVTLQTSTAQAGGGPENLFLVVNSRSFSSITIANYYIQFRKIPPINVFYLDWDGSLESVDINTFRTKILIPVLAAIETRTLSDQIDYIIYSSDIPYRIDFGSEVSVEERNKQGQLLQHPSGSLTGMTYLAEFVLVKNINYASLNSNMYFRGSPLGFRSWYGWGVQEFDAQKRPIARVQESGGMRYHLSTMLGVTVGRGNTLPEVINYLRRSAQADGTKPVGTVYFMKTDDKRSTTRVPQFDYGVKGLKALHGHGEIVNGAMPEKKSDVIGLMAGTASFDWNKTGCTLLPGALCDNLTSFGGVFGKHDQTPLSEFLRYGAAGATGPVTEPFAISNKFPLYNLHLHYLHGCSLAESFYQSILAPYQLLIVGDPLCMPYASIPEIMASDLEQGATIKGKRTIAPTAKATRDKPVEHFELYVNGARHSSCRAGEKLELDSTQFPDGYNELRIVGLEESQIETQGRLIVPVVFNNHNRSIEFSVSPMEKVKSGEKIKLAGKAPGSVGIAFYHNGQLVDKVAGESGEVEIDTTRLGYGPVNLSAIGWGRGGQENNVNATPVTFNIDP